MKDEIALNPEGVAWDLAKSCHLFRQAQHTAFGITCDSIFRYHAMDAFANKTDFCDLQITKFRFGGDVLLERGSQRTREGESDGGEGQREREESESPEGGFASSKRDPGKGRREKRGGGEVRPTARMNRQSAFARVESHVGFVRGGAQVVEGHVAEDEIAGRVGMSRERTVVIARQHVERGVFERVVAPGFEDEGKVEEHGAIIPL